MFTLFFPFRLMSTFPYRQNHKLDNTISPISRFILLISTRASLCDDQLYWISPTCTSGRIHHSKRVPRTHELFPFFLSETWFLLIESKVETFFFRRQKKEYFSFSFCHACVCVCVCVCWLKAGNYSIVCFFSSSYENARKLCKTRPSNLPVLGLVCSQSWKLNRTLIVIKMQMHGSNLSAKQPFFASQTSKKSEF